MGWGGVGWLGGWVGWVGGLVFVKIKDLFQQINLELTLCLTISKGRSNLRNMSGGNTDSNKNAKIKYDYLEHELYLCSLLASKWRFSAIRIFNMKNTGLTYWSQLLTLFVHMCTPKLLTVNSGDRP